MVVCGSNNATVYAYDATTGQPMWHYATAGDTKSSFAYDKHTRSVMFGTLGGQFYALNAQTGTPIYSKELKGGMYSTPLISNDTVYVSSLNKCVYALEIATWQEKWEYETNGRIFSSPTLHNNSLWIGSNDGRLHEIDPDTGKMLSFYQATEKIVNRIAYNKDSGRIFLPTCANELYCLKRTVQ